ncbi:hypothetical protein CERSUDRAFT_120079 [Gelatoporia subvermispora B]|uniref:Uncharacterized protein n=1 Tax=Ceriporiopsis subvermispora (strain B) TaxID=914234 RepID=M2P6Z6_CERS8|nr:hypothetical protein CERSUDRAFT_120079 [Gelatoporia subvermispora B]
MHAKVAIPSLFFLVANSASAAVINPALLAQRDIHSDVQQIASDAVNVGHDWMTEHGAQITAIGSAVQSIWGRMEPTPVAKRDLHSDLQQIAQDATNFGDDWMDVHGSQVAAVGSAVQSIWGRMEPTPVAKRDLHSDLQQIAQDATDFGNDWMNVHGSQVAAVGSAVQSIWGRAEPTPFVMRRDLQSDLQQLGQDAQQVGQQAAAYGENEAQQAAAYGESVAQQEEQNVQSLDNAITAAFGRRDLSSDAQQLSQDAQQIGQQAAAYGESVGQQAAAYGESVAQQEESNVQQLTNTIHSVFGRRRSRLAARQTISADDLNEIFSVLESLGDDVYDVIETFINELPTDREYSKLLLRSSLLRCKPMSAMSSATSLPLPLRPLLLQPPPRKSRVFLRVTLAVPPHFM